MIRRVLAVALLAVAAALGRADDPTLEDVFATTAAATGAKYVAGRATLMRQDAAAFLLASKHTDDADAGSRALARAIVVRTERAADCRAWDEALLAKNATLRLAAPGLPVIRFPSAGGAVETREVTFPPESAPFVVDVLRSGDGRFTAAVRVAGAARFADAAPYIVAALAKDWPPDDACAEALVAIGRDAAPSVRALLDVSDPRAAAAAQMLARLGDREAAPRLAELVDRTQDPWTLKTAAAALCILDPAAGVTHLVDRLLAVPMPGRPENRRTVTYTDLREALVPFGTAALDAAMRRLGTAATAVERARLGGIVWEFSDAARAAEAYTAIEAANRQITREFGGGDASARGRWAFWRVGDYGGGPPAGPEALVLERAASLGASRDLVWALEIDGGSALLREALRGPRRERYGAPELLRALAAKDPDSAIVVVDAMPEAEDPWSLQCGVDTLFLVLDRPKTRAVLERIAATPRADRDAEYNYANVKRHAQEALRVLAGERPLAALLKSNEKELNLAAARALATRGDAAGVRVLALAAITCEPRPYSESRDDLVRAGRAPDLEPGDDERMRVLRDAVAARIADRAAARKFDDDLRRRQPSYSNVEGPQADDFERGGEALGQDIGPEARALAEEAAVLQHDLVAIHALGVLGDERSIPVLRYVAGDPSRAGAVVVALRRMGAKAREAARALDGGAGDEALAGLAEAAPESAAERLEWERRMMSRLRATRWDDQVVEPAIRLLDGDAGPNGYVARAALGTLATVRDPRIVDACLPFLPGAPRDAADARREATDALRAQIGDGTVEFLTEGLPRIADRRLRCAAASALAFDYAAPLRTRAERDAVVAAFRREMVADDSPASAWAAQGLAMLHLERPAADRDPKDAAALVAWVAATASPGVGGYVAGVLVREKMPGAGEALLASYRRGHDSWVLVALSELRYAPAFDDVRAEIGRAVAAGEVTDWKYPGLGELTRLCDEGKRWVRGLLAPTNAWATRVAAAGALAVSQSPEAYDDCAALLDDPAAAAAFPTDLVWALAILDPARAHADFVRRAAAARDPAIGAAYAAAAVDLRTRWPDEMAPPAAR